MPKLSLTEIENRIRDLSEGEGIPVKCNLAKILLVQKQNGEYQAWNQNTKYTGDLDGLMALIARLRKRKPKKA
jgi:hypothetical protein